MIKLITISTMKTPEINKWSSKTKIKLNLPLVCLNSDSNLFSNMVLELSIQTFNKEEFGLLKFLQDKNS